MREQVGLLKANFQEIYSVVQTASPRTLPLVANFAGTHIYASNCGWGRLWRWFYSLAEWLTGHELRFEKLTKALLHTHSLFHHNLEFIKPFLQQYQNHLLLASKGYAVNKSDYLATRRVITEWNSSTVPFVKMMRHLSHDCFKGLLRDCFKVHSERDLSALFEPSQEISNTLSAYQKVINLESLIEAPLPLPIFKKIFREKPLNNSDQKELTKWIRKINRANPPTHVLHKGISAIASQLGHENDLTAKLEILLEDKGCTILQKEDPKHLRWCQKLKSGSKLTLNGSKITLGNEVISHQLGNDYRRAFTLNHHPEELVLCAQNKALLHMYLLRQKIKTESPIAPVKLETVDTGGKLALIECLQPLPIGMKTDVSAEDPLINALSQWLKSLTAQNFTPLPLSPGAIMYDKQFRLKSLIPLKQHTFDFNALEDFALQCAAGNLTTFQHLMSQSELIQHPVAKYYREMIENSLIGEYTAAADLAGIYKISDPKVVDRGLALANEILRLQKQLYAQLRPHNLSSTSQELNRQIAQALLQSYLASKAAGILWPSLTSDVLKKFK